MIPAPGTVLLHPSGTPPTRFQVLGERSSGTNYLKRLLSRNTTMQPTEALGWKHGFPQALAIPADLAVICITRNAADWARSMHAKPWHSTPDLQRLAFGDFIRAEWTTITDRARYFDPGTPIGEPLQQDRDPVTGLAFANLFALRRAKLTGLCTYANRRCSFALIRIEDMLADPAATLAALRAGFALPASDAAPRLITRRLGSKFKPAVEARPDTPAALAPDDLAFLRSQIDPAQESALGYSY